jgi:serine-type D-Ala-D-Ala carboxypeptidase (penicillin-binding protein 5/6)
MARARPAPWVWIVFIAVIGAMLITAATFVTVKLTAPAPPATVSIQVPAAVPLDGAAPPTIPTPANGSFALATSLGGTVATRAPAAVRPIGSVAKAMTALVVLAAHPVSPGAPGPSIVMTNADVLLYRQAVTAGGSNLPVHAGEILTERDLLLALLLPSADNIAETLAVWVSGTRSRFIARLNATATAMGMDHTHFADPSGLSVSTVSTALDLVVLARAVIANPALAELVGSSRAVLSNGTILNNLDILLTSQTGWLGIKTGWTGAAGGCLLFAARMTFGTSQGLTVWGAILGQPPSAAGDPAHPELGQAFTSAQSGVAAALGAYKVVDLSEFLRQISGSISTRWGDSSSVTLSEQASVYRFVHAGAALSFHVSVLRPGVPTAAGTTVAEVTGTLNQQTSIVWNVVSTSAIAGPSFWWKLFSG